MSVYEVPEAKWARFCERFARDHRGEIVTVELARDARAAEHEIVIDRRPLAGLSLAQGDSGRHVVVTTDGLQGRRDELMLPDPERLVLEQHGAQGGLLRIDSATFRTLLVRCDRPVIPGELNGWP